MQENQVLYSLPGGAYNHLIGSLRDVGYTVDIHDPHGRWPDVISNPEGKLAGRLDSPFCLVAELENPGGEELRNFMMNYNPSEEELGKSNGSGSTIKEKLNGRRR